MAWKKKRTSSQEVVRLGVSLVFLVVFAGRSVDDYHRLGLPTYLLYLLVALLLFIVVPILWRRRKKP